LSAISIAARLLEQAVGMAAHGSAARAARSDGDCPADDYWTGGGSRGKI